MRGRFERISCILYFVGNLLIVMGVLLLFPIVLSLFNWGKYGEGPITIAAFVIPSAISFILAIFLRRYFRQQTLDTVASMLMCSVSWLIASALGAIPFVIALRCNYIDAYFEAMSGFTTTGITVFAGLDDMPRSILFWRSLTQWLGGIGILSFFLVVTYGSSGAHHIFGAESHKISSGRPSPGLFSTLKILWSIYILFTVSAAAAYFMEKMPLFDSVCHALTTLSTGGFSPHDASIEFYRINNHPNYRLIEYTVTFFMMLGGINFLVHFRVLTGDFKALWDNLEVRYWWRLILAFTGLLIIDHMYKSGALKELFTRGGSMSLSELEEIFRNTIFQVIGVLTTTGFGTKDIGGGYFPALSRQLFLVMMVIGGCVGSTGGGFKVLRIAILNRLMLRELFKMRVSPRASSTLVIDNKPVPDDEIHRIGALFFTWVGFYWSAEQLPPY